MQLRYRYRVYPTPEQQNALAQSFGCARVVFNDCLRLRQDSHRAGVKISDTEIQRRVITLAKKSPERSWLAEVASVVLVQACGDARRAYRNWFDSLSGKRKGRRVGPPRFRSRRDSLQSIRLTRNGFSIRANRRLYLAKVGELAVRWSRELPSDPSSVTIIRDSTGRYFASFVVDTNDVPMPPSDSEVGIDLGLETFAVLSDGRTISSPRFLRRAARRLRVAQQRLSRKRVGSQNRHKQRIRVAKAHAAVADARRDWAHKQSTAIIRENQAVFVEDLCVSGMARTRLAKSIHDAGWSMFVNMLEYKAARYGRVFGKVERFYPSSQICSGCGVRSGRKHLSLRKWTCSACHAVHDRDHNAAKNIHAAGRAEWQNACGESVSLTA
ncbi:RNA-guided endonuclease InsQ/TnpB family protein [Nocardia sp. NPDC058176]|uniref:RNA-guided endonuclease InsQ/TnpB family protein n=1 Tax=Nocardia sp. NPDC058176 TaxID=3346368 RepID=UPI0036DE94E8